MKKVLSLLLTLLIVFSCGVSHVIPIETQYNIKDSTAIHYIDSTVIIPVEVIKDVVPVYDTLMMETSMAKSISYVDTTTHTLKGSLTNKKGVEYKYIYKDKIQYKDSIVVKEVPVPVEVEKVVSPKYEKYLWLSTIFFVILLMYELYKIYRKFRP